MADEISISLQATVQNGLLSIMRGPFAFKDDQFVPGSEAGVVIVGTTEEDIDYGDLVGPGWMWVKNLDSANHVNYGPKSAGNMVAFGQLDPGMEHMFFLYPGAILRWVAPIAEVRVDTLILESTPLPTTGATTT